MVHTSTTTQVIRPEHLKRWRSKRQMASLSVRRKQAEQGAILVRADRGDKWAFRAAGIPSRKPVAAALFDVEQLSFSKEVISKAYTMMRSKGRKTLIDADVDAALRLMGVRRVAHRAQPRHRVKARAAAAAADA